jgi:hypothetical protein
MKFVRACVELAHMVAYVLVRYWVLVQGEPCHNMDWAWPANGVLGSILPAEDAQGVASCQGLDVYNLPPDSFL